MSTTKIASAARGVREHIREFAGLDKRTKLAIAWSFAYFFCVLCSYYIIRPLRDAMSVTVGPDRLEALFFIVFFVMLAAVPLFGWVVRRFPRRWVAPAVYAFFIANLGIFWLVMSQHDSDQWVASAFFVWVGVFNLFVVSLFWIVMSDIWSAADAKRFYGVIAAGGSAGAVVGPILTRVLVKQLGSANLLLISALFLGIAVFCAIRLRRLTFSAAPEPGVVSHDAPAGGNLIAGALRVLDQPYLGQIALWVLATNLISTFFYFEQARIVKAALPDRADQIQLFAAMDTAANALMILAQLLITGALIRRIGVGLAIAALPVSALVALAALSMAPVLTVIVAIVVAERTIGFALANPAFKTLYTVVAPEDKYKSQNFIDTVVFRGGDAASGWIFNSGVKSLGLATHIVAVAAVPIVLAWIILSFRLGREQAAREAAAPAKPPTVEIAT